MKSCNNCLWNYEGMCVHESLDNIINDVSYGTCDCIGWLREDLEEHLYNTYEEIKQLIKNRNCKELEDILKFIKSQRGE